MLIYLLADNPEDPESVERIRQAIEQWLQPGRPGCSLSLGGDHQSVGVALETAKKLDLKEPLNLLYALAQQESVEFVIGTVDPNSNAHTPVCYFGHEEGRPDLQEIALYLGLKR